MAGDTSPLNCWDKSQPTKLVIRNSDTSPATVRPARVIFVRASDKTIFAEGVPGEVYDVGALTFIPPKYELPHAAAPMDPRTFGLADWASIEEGSQFKSIKAALQELKNGELRKEPDGRSRVTVNVRDLVQYEYWVNPEKGFTVERSELRHIDAQTGERSEVFSTTDVTWENRTDVWVPTSIHLERTDLPRTYSAKLAWENMNEPLDPELFEIQNLEVAPSTFVIDRRQVDRSIVWGHVSDFNNSGSGQ